MSSRKVYTEILVKVVFVLEEGTTIDEAIQEIVNNKETN